MLTWDFTSSLTGVQKSKPTHYFRNHINHIPQNKKNTQKKSIKIVHKPKSPLIRSYSVFHCLSSCKVATFCDCDASLSCVDHVTGIEQQVVGGGNSGAQRPEQTHPHPF